MNLVQKTRSERFDHKSDWTGSMIKQQLSSPEGKIMSQQHLKLHSDCIAAECSTQAI